MGAIANDEMITAKDGQQHSWKSVKPLIAAIFEVAILLVSVWYSREMVEHHCAKINQPA